MTLPRIGIAGLGDIARLHARALADVPEVQLAVCRGRNPESADSFARDFGAVVYDSYEAMLADNATVAVDLCVPNHLHREYAEAAAAAGKHVICEKPLAMTASAAEAIVRSCEAAGVQLLVAHVLRFWPEYGHLRQWLQSRRLGECRAITMRRMLSLLISVPGREGWRRDPGRMGGAVIDLQIHDIDFLVWTFGVPRTVYCTAARSSDGGLNHCYSLLTFQDGPQAMIEASYMLQGDPMIFTTKAICEHGSLDYAMNLQDFGLHAMEGATTSSSAPASLTCYRPNADPEVLASSNPKILEIAFGAQMGYFADCVLGRMENSVASAADAVTAVRIAEACRQSAETGAVIHISHDSAARLSTY